MSDPELKMTIESLARRGVPERQIARQLALSEGAVRHHLKRIEAPPPPTAVPVGGASPSTSPSIRAAPTPVCSSDRAHHEGEATASHVPPMPLGRLGAVLERLGELPLEHRSADLYGAIAWELAR